MSSISSVVRSASAAALFVTVFGATAAFGQPLGFAQPANPFGDFFGQMLRDPTAEAARPNARGTVQPSDEDGDETAPIPAHLRRQIVSYPTSESAGTVVIDTRNTYLYYVLGGGRAIRYGIGVGREGFTWSGVQTVARKAEWPDWTPPPEMIARQPYLPRFMAGGPSNPLGARAMYLGDTIYRIHGTNAPQTIGSQVSSGCIRLVNEDVMDLYSRVHIGTKVVVLPMSGARTRSAQHQPAAPSTAGGASPIPRIN